jgi:signal transduction histidine kinase/HAMP domain-containing protein
MTTARTRVLPLVGAACLAVQGVLLGMAAGAPGTEAGPAWVARGLLPVLALAVAVVLAFCRRRSGTLALALWRIMALVGVSALLALGLWSVADRPSDRPGDPDNPRSARQVAAAAAALQGVESAMAPLAADAGPALAEADGGEIVRILATMPDRWQQVEPVHGALPLSCVLWRGGERVAWSDGAVPLPAPGRSDSALVTAGADGFVYRRFHRLAAGILESQIVLGGRAWRAEWPLVGVTVGGLQSGGRQADLGLGDAGPAVGLEPVLPDGVPVTNPTAARVLTVALVVWVLTAAAFARVCAAGLTWLLPLWLGRGLLAAVEWHRWLAAAWPAAEQPARAHAAASLWDPAYFATPVLGGWFASVIDALVTALLLAVTAWQLMQRAGAVSTGRSRGLRTGLGFGAAAGAVLAILAGLAGLLAVNANPRLIGQDVPLGYLSFWFLHASLMLVSLSLGVLLVRGAAGAWPRRADRRAWTLGGFAAAAAAGLVAAAVGAGSAMTAGLVAILLWWTAPGLGQRDGLRRRLVWPAVVILTGLWNHAALREVYAEGERGWLESKAQVIAATDTQWRRFLLGEVLSEMQAIDDPAAPAAVRADVRRQEPAWRLWRWTALRDLGLPCVVELQDPDGRSQALFATGFLRDFSYEPADQSPWQPADSEFGAEDPELYFRTERRLYAGGEEEILIGEIVRRGGQGWIHVEVPLRSWRIDTLLAELTGAAAAEPGHYRPRSEIDRPVLLLHADDSGWLDAGQGGFPDTRGVSAFADLRGGAAEWAEIEAGGRRWLCRWQPLPEDRQRTPGEGFLLGLARPTAAETLLDVSRLLLLDLALLLLAAAAVQAMRALERRLGGDRAPAPWRSGFQERFLAGYLVLGLVLLVLVGAAVDRVAHERIAGEAANRARTGLDQSIEQLRTLLADQARAMAASEYIEELLTGQISGARPLGPVSRQQGMIFDEKGGLLLDETLGNLQPDQAAALLEAARRAPLVVQRDGEDIYVGTVIPIDLGGLPAFTAAGGEGPRLRDDLPVRGFFYYRQRLDSWLLYSLANLVQGEITLRFDGQPLLASHPGPVFTGAIPPLAESALLEAMLDHPSAPGVAAAARRPFALTGCQPMPAFIEPAGGGLQRRAVPALLTVTFPDREREYAAQRRAITLFLAGLANLILLTALGLAVFMSWNIFRPLRLLMGATRSLAAGDYEAPLPESGRDEVGRLADAFGRMRGDLRAARDDLAARERFLATVLDRVTVGVAVVASDGTVAALNPAGRQILADFRPGIAEQDAARGLQRQVIAGQAGAAAGAAQLRSADGRRTLRVALAPLDLPGGRDEAMLVFEDITDFLEAQKLAINAELARQVAHEIKNPLTPIQLSVQLLGQAWRDGHPGFGGMVEPTIERVLAQVELLRKIAAEFSLLGRPGALETAPLELGALLRETAAAYAGADGAAPVMVPEADPPTVLADADSLRKILGNLMQNSLDAAPSDGALEVRVGWRIEPDAVTMVWKDNGQGIPADVADRLFDPYFSTKSAGTGLGLAICRNLADRMGGRITLTNRDDGPGAVAELTLRRARASR